MIKAIIIGPSTSGKTTVIKHLLEKNTGLHTKEIDDELVAANNGTYPHDAVYKQTVLAPPIKEKVINHEGDLLFFSNADYFIDEELLRAKQNGFKIILFAIDVETMKKRNAHRVAHEGYDDLSKYFEIMLRYMNNIKKKNIQDAVIDSTKSVEQIVAELLKSIHL